ncbi:MAG: DUF4342 domain-containing protein [Clostridiales bacterium]|jgi:hypothetical protein|nr:DUF4342 domain-containing protein [Clostridiales bacterium]
MCEKQKTEEFKINSEELIAKLKAIIKEGNAKKVTIKGKDDNEILSFPLTVGVVGIALAPVFAAAATIAALATECSIVIER